ncbi:putative transcription factor bHLH family [Helianthus annuus]|nr:putative transcription factor bHLH family [Helianthus annuus]
MELPQPRPYGTQGRKPTHNFLSLYSPAQQDPSSIPPGGFLETHDFLQPLERTEGNKFEEPTSAVEHILPGGTGTYSISHISCISQSQSQRMGKDEGVVIRPVHSSGSDRNDENSNCSSYTGSGFSLWEESAVKGKTGKENIAGNTRVIREGGIMKTGEGPWVTSVERPSQSSSAHNHPTASISSLSSSRPSSAQNNPSFVDVLKFAKSSRDDEDDEEHGFVIKQEPSSHYKGVLSVKVDTSHHDQKPNTPRSKHSATEQRRRSKINDRFTMLREIIPQGDQKRDKASFLLEVIEYIRFLQEKTHMYEDSCRNNNNNDNNQRPTEGFIDQPLVNKGNVSLNLPKKGQALLDTNVSLQEQIGQNPCLTNNRSCTNDCTASNKLKDEEVTIESGTISISTIYSQGLLSTLTQALQNSGVDLSQANISVQIDLGKRANPSTPIFKKNEVSGMDETFAGSRLASTREEKSDKALKRFKTDRN